MAYTFALAGNPNCGKTTLFNQLTGSTAHVGNWPGVTVERKEGKCKKQGLDISVVDLPGIYSLSPYSPEEVVSRNYLIDGSPDVVINIIDGTNLERNLYLTTQILEIDVPVVVALNMIDMLEKNKDSVDIRGLEKVLGVPVIPISASQNKGINELISAAANASKSKGDARSVIAHSSLGKYILELEEILRRSDTPHPLYYATKYIEQDEQIEEALPKSSDVKAYLKQNQSEIDRITDGDPEALSADLRYKFITKSCQPLIKRSKRSNNLTTSDKIDKVLTHRILGIPIFILIMFLMFHLTFSENLLGTGLNSPGKFLEGLMGTGIEWITGIVESGLIAINASEWAIALVVDGILAGVGAVMGFLPLVLILYLFISILEDSGYMARAAFIMDRLLRRFGLSGKSFVPMIMGFGCSVPAISATRTLENEKDRRLTIMLIPFMSCGAKIPIYGLIVPIFFPNHTDIVTTLFYVLGVAIAIICGIILKKTVFKGDVSPFIMELPTYRMPSIKSLGIHLWDKFKGFATKVGTIITVATIVIWFLANFGFDGGFGMVEANSASSILGYLGNALKFIFIPLGFASGPDGWKAVVAVLTGLIAKEAVVSTMGQLYTTSDGDALEDEGAATALAAVIASTMSIPAALSFITWNLFSIPCMAAVGAMSNEMNSKKYFWGTLGFQLVVAWVMSFLVFWISTLVMSLV